MDTDQELDRAIETLCEGAVRLAKLPLKEAIELTEACLQPVHQAAQAWVDASCRAKRVQPGSPAAAEEITAGPVAVLRYLQLWLATLRDIDRDGAPRLPGEPRVVEGRVRAPVFPTRQLYDSLLFPGLRAETWLEPGVGRHKVFGSAVDRVRGTAEPAPTVSLVLGAGNVSSIPVTDALSKILQEGQAVLLKLNPVNAYLGDCFADSLRPLIDAGFLRIINGGADLGARAIADPRISAVHITGSIDTHDKIVWGGPGKGLQDPTLSPQLNKPITSELGNVSPWMIAPARYSQRGLRHQTEAIVASITNNASFNCVATKVVITSRQWPQREEFLDRLQARLAALPPRYAYYPGAKDRFEEATGEAIETSDGRLPWTLLRDRQVSDSLHLFGRESFVCVCAETGIDGASTESFLANAVEFANHQLWGTLSAAITIPSRSQKQNRRAFERALSDLRYGAIGINQWPALAFALMSPPWGGHPAEASLRDAQSGLGFVHNTFQLNRPEKTVLQAPLCAYPKPLWYAGHRRASEVAWRLCALYAQPRLVRLPGLIANAIRG